MDRVEMSSEQVEYGADGFEAESARSVLRECTRACAELFEVLSLERDILRRFACEELLKIIARKEFAVNELRGKLQLLFRLSEGNPSIKDDPEYVALKPTLATIDELNQLNRVFVEGSLDFWQTFLGLLQPVTYRPDQLEPSQKRGAAVKGLAFSREV